MDCSFGERGQPMVDQSDGKRDQTRIVPNREARRRFAVGRRRIDPAVSPVGARYEAM
jgi:hypothetical protein